MITNAQLQNLAAAINGQTQSIFEVASRLGFTIHSIGLNTELELVIDGRLVAYALSHAQRLAIAQNMKSEWNRFAIAELTP